MLLQVSQHYTIHKWQWRVFEGHHFSIEWIFITMWCKKDGLMFHLEPHEYKCFLFNQDSRNNSVLSSFPPYCRIWLILRSLKGCAPKAVQQVKRNNKTSLPHSLYPTLKRIKLKQMDLNQINDHWSQWCHLTKKFHYLSCYSSLIR